MVECNICPHKCVVPEGSAGRCGAKENIDGELISVSYGVVSSVALDPIEKKPLYHFKPGRPILSIGGFGCNLACPFCQNHEIAISPVPFSPVPFSPVRKGTEEGTEKYPEISAKKYAKKFTPAEIVAMAKDIPNNIGIAYTYNEPLINYEFLLDCAKLVKEAKLSNVLVTNGFINPEPMADLLPYIDAMNIDLKGFTEEYYGRLGGDLKPVMETIVQAVTYGCFVEVTTLIVPGENEDDVEPIAKWLGELNPDIPLHITRFFPRHICTNVPPTPVETIHKLCGIAREYLRYVYPGNV